MAEERVPAPAEAPRLIRAPWDAETVAALNDFQVRGGMHPFTCGRDHFTPGEAVLVATADGWVCSRRPACSYTQDWAHAFMADRSAWPSPLSSLRAWDRVARGEVHTASAVSPETAAPVDAGEANTGGVVSPDTGNGSGELRSKLWWEAAKTLNRWGNLHREAHRKALIEIDNLAAVRDELAHQRDDHRACANAAEAKLAEIRAVLDEIDRIHPLDFRGLPSLDSVLDRLRAILDRDPAPLPDSATERQATAAAPEEPCPEGYHWIGQLLTHCDTCGMAPWDHAGEATLKPDADPFGSDNPWVLRPWKPGEREALQAKYGRARAEREANRDA